MIQGLQFQSEAGILCGVAIESVIYLLGNVDYGKSSHLWKLIQNTDGSFDWNTICIEKHEMPSPRIGQCGWEYGDKVWIFGGHGISPKDFLWDHGDYDDDSFTNNQLFSYDPSVQTWKNMKCSGDVPSPRHAAAATIIKDKVWLHGGSSAVDWEDDLYELNMASLAWTRIQTGQPRPEGSRLSSLTPLTHNKLALYGLFPVVDKLPDFELISCTWILDVEQYQWRQYQKCVRCDCFPTHKSAAGLNNDVIILCSHNNYVCKSKKLILPVVLEPKSLQHLAMRIIYQNQANLPLNSLPLALRRRLTE